MGPAMREDPFPLAFFSPSPTSPPSKTPLPPPPPLSSHPLFRSSLPPLPPPWTPSSPAAGAPARGDRFVEHSGDLAGVPAELLPLKKRIVRYHPYAAAWAIQEMAATTSRGGFGDQQLQQRREGEEEDGLRAELLRLRISRPALVLTKPLTVSDRKRDMARLVLPERLVRASPLLGMLTAAERRLAFGSGLPVPALDRLGRGYRMILRRDPSAGTFLLRGQWTLYLSRHDMRDGDAVQLLAFRPSAWQARLDKHGEGGLGMAVLHCPSSCPKNHNNVNDGSSSWTWTNRERDAADGLLLLIAAACSRLTGGGLQGTTPLVSTDQSQLLGVR